MSGVADRLRNLTIPSPPAEGFADGAFADGRAGAAYGKVSTPIGEFTAVVTHRGLLNLIFEGQDQDRALQRVADKVTPRILEAPSAAAFVQEKLDDYFRGRTFRIEMPLDRSLLTPYQGRVLDFTYGIPAGETRTYRQAAEGAGDPRAARATGRALATNPIPVVLPCHRIVASNGELRGYAGGLDHKRFLLEHEGFLR